MKHAFWPDGWGALLRVGVQPAKLFLAQSVALCNDGVMLNEDIRRHEAGTSVLRFFARGFFLLAFILTMVFGLGYAPVLTAVVLILLAAVMLWRSWTLADRAEPRE